MENLNTIKILENLISFPTVSRDANLGLIEYVAKIIECEKVKPIIIKNNENTKANLFASIGPENSDGIMLSGHTDVVPIDGQNWTKPPFECTYEDGLYFGRGTADMKGFVASAINSFIKAKSINLKKPLYLALSYDEEVGCLGVRSLIDLVKELKFKPSMCIVGEPTSMSIATGHKGKTALRADCEGVEAHSALAPKGTNAIYLACDLINEIRNIQSEIVNNGIKDYDYDIPYTTLHVGKISGGIVLNIVPNKSSVDFEIRNLAEDDPYKILNELKSKISLLLKKINKKAPNANIKINITNQYPGLNTQINAEIVSFVSSLTGKNNTIKVAFGTEGGLFDTELDIPTVVCGPGSMDQGHKPDEYVSKKQLEMCDHMLENLIKKMSN
jgi:acetylornithine deacetylase